MKKDQDRAAREMLGEQGRTAEGSGHSHHARAGRMRPLEEQVRGNGQEARYVQQDSTEKTWGAQSFSTAERCLIVQSLTRNKYGGYRKLYLICDVVVYGVDYETLFEWFKSSVQFIPNAKLEQHSLTRGEIHILRKQWVLPCEEITIIFHETPDGIQVTIHSKPVRTDILVDWGRNQENINCILSFVEGQLSKL